MGGVEKHDAEDGQAEDQESVEKDRVHKLSIFALCYGSMSFPLQNDHRPLLRRREIESHPESGHDPTLRGHAENEAR